MRTAGLFFGLILIIFSLLFFFNPHQAFFLVDNKEHTYTINESFNESNLNFNFSKNYISGNAYLNLYVDDFNGYEINSTEINDCLYEPNINKHITSFVIPKMCLNEKEQSVNVGKNASLVIDKMEMQYRGLDYGKHEIYDELALYLSLLLIFFAMIFTFYSFRK